MIRQSRLFASVGSRDFSGGNTHGLDEDERGRERALDDAHRRAGRLAGDLRAGCGGIRRGAVCAQPEAGRGAALHLHADACGAVPGAALRAAGGDTARPDDRARPDRRSGGGAGARGDTVHRLLQSLLQRRGRPGLEGGLRVRGGGEGRPGRVRRAHCRHRPVHCRAVREKPCGLVVRQRLFGRPDRAAQFCLLRDGRVALPVGQAHRGGEERARGLRSGHQCGRGVEAPVRAGHRLLRGRVHAAGRAVFA